MGQRQPQNIKETPKLLSYTKVANSDFKFNHRAEIGRFSADSGSASAHLCGQLYESFLKDLLSAVIKVCVARQTWKWLFSKTLLSKLSFLF